MSEPSSTPPAAGAPTNRYDRFEWGGAFGDLGTLVPFVLAYVTIVDMDALGILLAFGASMLACGLYYRTPVPVQPMKAVGAVAALQAGHLVTPAVVVAAALVTAVVWLALGLTGLAAKLAKLVPACVVAGIVLGLGFGFMLEGVRQMQSDWVIAAVAATGTFVLMRSRTVPAMFALLACGLAWGLWSRPELAAQLRQHGIDPRLPQLAATSLSWKDLGIAAALLALPQVPMTLGNAVIAIKEENNRLYPQRPITERGISVSTGLMNLLSAAIGGVPMCHGAGGMAGHVAFGARTGGAVVILGAVLLLLGLFFSDSVQVLFRLLPAAILGVILFLAGLQLALGARTSGSRGEQAVMLATAALCVWNVAIGFVVGIALHRLLKRGALRP